MAARIEKVEREFIISNAADSSLSARVQGPHGGIPCRFLPPKNGLIRFLPQGGEGDQPPFRAWDSVSVNFEFHGQAMTFTTRVKNVDRALLELEFPETMYRDLLRRWPRVAPPKGFEASLLLPGSGLELPCPPCREYTELYAPKSSFASESLNGIVDRFKQKAADMADESRVVMYSKGRWPSDLAEETIAELGRALFLPSLKSGLPTVDPYPEGRIITRSSYAAAHGLDDLSPDSKILSFIRQKSLEGLNSALWYPILYYRYAVGFAYLGIRGPRCVDLAAVEFVHDFCYALAWSLKVHGYFDAQASHTHEDLQAVSLVDISASGILVSLDQNLPRLKPSATVDLVLSDPSGQRPLKARVARAIGAKKNMLYGLAFESIGEKDEDQIAKGIYGPAAEEISKSQGGHC